MTCLGHVSSQKKIYLSAPHLSGNEQKYINEAIKTNWVAPVGPNIDAFEQEMANFIGVNEAVAVNSGTAAIHLALSLLGVKKGDKVFCSSLTFVASANPIIYQGAEPVFIDSEPDSWNMSPHALETALQDSLSENKLPKAIIVVNLYGQSAKMDEIIELSNKYGVPIIEDAAESLGTIYKGKASGTFGKFGVFSFNGNKIITTSGGGMLICHDSKLASKARFLATQAKDQALHYQHSQMGFNYRMSNVLAGIGRGQLEVLKERVSARRSIFNRYYKELKEINGITFMDELKDTQSNRWLTSLLINEKEIGFSSKTLLELLAQQNIEARPVWKPLHLQPLFKGTKYYPHSDVSVSERLFDTGICLPSGSNLAEEDQTRVIQCIRNAVRRKVIR